MELWWLIFTVKVMGLESLRKCISRDICENVSTLGEGSRKTEPKYGWYHSKGYGLTRDDIGRHSILLLSASWPQRPYAQLLHASSLCLLSVMDCGAGHTLPSLVISNGAFCHSNKQANPTKPMTGQKLMSPWESGKDAVWVLISCIVLNRQQLLCCGRSRWLTNT